MRCRMRFFRFAMAIFLAAFTGVASAQTTVMFQNGLNGFNGLLEVYSGLGGVGPDMNVLGSDVDNTFLDGVYDTGDDTQGLLRFDGILNEIPAGATITSAVLEFTTSEVGNAQSGGPYGVSQLLVPFDENSTYAGAAMGWRFNQGEAARPLPNGFISLDVGETNGADVTPIVQAWVDGDPNHGFLITAGTTNGWSVITSGFQLEPSVRPKLTVEFTTGGNDRKATTAFLTQSPTDNSNSMFIADAILMSGRPISSRNRSAICCNSRRRPTNGVCWGGRLLGSAVCAGLRTAVGCVDAAGARN